MAQFCRQLLKLSPIVEEALLKNKPIVALESTIISHGMPYPKNKQCALSIQQIIRDQNAVPATVAIFDGIIHVGLNSNQIQKLAFEGSKVKKVSRRDLPQIISCKGIGATTVSATMIASQMAGISIFVTGGIGGVHRGYEETMDVSADLRQLGRTPIAVVSAGVKSILDISRTLEYLQTEGVPVVTYKSKYFPAFFSSSSGIQSPLTLNTHQEIARLIFSRERLDLKNGILIAVPNNSPAEGKIMEDAIQIALKQAHDQHINGALVTPFVLKRVNQLTGGKSMESNISLVHNNARFGALVACELSALKQATKNSLNKIQLSFHDPKTTRQNKKQTFNIQEQRPNRSELKQNVLEKAPKGKLIVIGASAVDYQYRPLKHTQFEFYKTSEGRSKRSFGGIARNIAECGSKLGVETVLITPLGEGDDAEALRKNIQQNQIKLREIPSKGYTAAQFLAIMDSKNDEMLGISDMKINQQLTFNHVYEAYFKEQLHNHTINHNDIVVIDAGFNSNQQNFADLLKLAQFLNQLGYFTVFECKGQLSKKIILSEAYKYISMVRMNWSEKQDVIRTLNEKNNKILPENELSWLQENIFSEKLSKKDYEHYHVDIRSIITQGAKSLKVLHRKKAVESVPIYESKAVVKTIGAGDTFTATFCSLILKGFKYDQAIRLATVASKMTIQSEMHDSPICRHINLENIQKEFLKITSKQSQV